MPEPFSFALPDRGNAGGTASLAQGNASLITSMLPRASFWTDEGQLLDGNLCPSGSGQVGDLPLDPDIPSCGWFAICVYGQAFHVVAFTHAADRDWAPR